MIKKGGVMGKKIKIELKIKRPAALLLQVFLFRNMQMFPI
jgi:hypothetical protein